MYDPDHIGTDDLAPSRGILLGICLGASLIAFTFGALAGLLFAYG